MFLQKYFKFLPGLSEIKDSINNVEVMINGLTKQVRNDLITQRFVNLQSDVNYLQKVYNEYTEDKDIEQKNRLNKTCNGTPMKKILTQLHSEIVTGNDNTFKALLKATEMRCKML